MPLLRETVRHLACLDLLRVELWPRLPDLVYSSYLEGLEAELVFASLCGRAPHDLDLDISQISGNESPGRGQQKPKIPHTQPHEKWAWQR